MSQNCPVCNKTGLPDYKTQEVICPQCNSDLRAYMLLNTISNLKREKTNILFPTSIIVLALSLLIIFLLYKSGNRTSIDSEVVSNTYITKMDSTNYYKVKLSALTDSISRIPTEKELVIDYTIKNGDCLSEISYNFYGDWKLYSKIETDNNLVKPYKLMVGQVIKIKMKVK